MRWLPAFRGWSAQRWVIFEALPIQFVSEVQRASLWDEDNADDPQIKWTKEYLRQEGAVPMPLWVCQASPMGHPWAYSPVERALSSAGLLPREVPIVGSLPYSEPTDYTWAAISRRSILKRSIKDPFAYAAHLKEQTEKKVRKEMLRRTEADITDVALASKKTIYANAKRVDTDKIDDDWKDKYIETGSLY